MMPLLNKVYEQKTLYVFGQFSFTNCRGIKRHNEKSLFLVKEAETKE